MTFSVESLWGFKLSLCKEVVMCFRWTRQGLPQADEFWIKKETAKEIRSQHPPINGPNEVALV